MRGGWETKDWGVKQGSFRAVLKKQHSGLRLFLSFRGAALLSSRSQAHKRKRSIDVVNVQLSFHGRLLHCLSSVLATQDQILVGLKLVEMKWRIGELGLQTGFF